MREIKFRVRQIGTNILEIFDMGHNYLFGDYEILGQFTGLEDVRYQEIYEGDIVTFDYEIGEHDYIEEKQVVKYSKENACFMFGDDICMLDSSRIKNLEVVGNIYENPELLGASNG